MKYNKDNILQYVYESNDLEFIKYIYKKLNIKEQSVSFLFKQEQEIISSINKLEILKYLNSSRLNYRPILSNMIKKKNKTILKYIVENLPKDYCYCFIIGYLCYIGDLDLIKKIHEKDMIQYSEYPEYKIDFKMYDFGAFRYACRSGNVDLVKFILEIEPSIDIEIMNNCAIKFACQEGHMEMVKFLLFKCPNIITKLKMVENPSCDNIKNSHYLEYKNYDKCGRFNCNIFCYALRSRNLHLISYLISLDPSKITQFEKNMIYEDSKIRYIQNWFKEILLNPYSKYGQKRLEKIRKRI